MRAMFRAFRRVIGRRGYRRISVPGRVILLGLAASVALAGSPRAQTDASGFLIVTIGSDETIREVADKYLERSRSLARDPPHLGDRDDCRPQAGNGAPHSGQRDYLGQPGAGRLSARSRRRTSPEPRFSPRTRSAAPSIFMSRRWKSGCSVNGSRPRISPKPLSTKRRPQSRCPSGTAILPPKPWSPTGTARSRASGRRISSWRDLGLRSILIEEEKVRTLSDSTAQITFRDASRLRLNANSNAVIRQMRFDPLSKREEAKVSLIEGDFYALLAGRATTAAASASRFRTSTRSSTPAISGSAMPKATPSSPITTMRWSRLRPMAVRSPSAGTRHHRRPGREAAGRARGVPGARAPRARATKAWST